MNTAQLSWTVPNVIPRVALDPQYYEQELDVSAMDPATSVLYMYATSDVSQDVSLFSISTASFSVISKVPSMISPLAMEYFNGTLLAVVQAVNVNTSEIWLEVYRVDVLSGEATLYASLSPNWPASLSASAVDVQGNLYLGVGNAEDPPTIWRIATVTQSGSVSFSQSFQLAILSLLPMP
jgi:hypothetical protein